MRSFEKAEFVGSAAAHRSLLMYAATGRVVLSVPSFP